MENQSLQPYYNRTDALALAGITPKQENHWRTNGLFEPEIGDRRYTTGDVEKLKFVKSLIVDLGLSVAAVSRLIKNVRDENLLTNEEMLIEVGRGMLLRRKDIGIDYLKTLVNKASEEELAELLLNIALIYFSSLTKKYRHRPGIYESHRDALFENLQRMDTVARVFIDEHQRGFFDPVLPSDQFRHEEELHPFTGEFITSHLINEKTGRIINFQELSTEYDDRMFNFYYQSDLDNAGPGTTIDTYPYDLEAQEEKQHSPPIEEGRESLKGSIPKSGRPKIEDANENLSPENEDINEKGES